MEDFRYIDRGKPIPREQYTDQPYVVVADDGAWVCVLTTAYGQEGAAGTHVGITVSYDRGNTWTDLYFPEGDDLRESAYGVLLKTSFNRIYCFYNFNKNNLRNLICRKERLSHRVDMQGALVFRYSDDSGKTWSERYEVPIRETKIDRENPYGGKVRMFWTVSKPFILDNDGYVIIHKIGDMLTVSEGWLLRAVNMNTEKDPNKLVWETLPDGDIGLITPKGGGLIAEEQSMVVLSDKSIYCVYRSIDGHPVETYSRDKGHTWEQPQYKRYADNRLMKHPRAANFVWKCKNGKYLYWYHNNGSKWYENRNPAFLCSGIEYDTKEGRRIKWSQPEVLLYHEDPGVRMSYPDFIEDSDKYYITETQKLDARVHEIPEKFLQSLWNQFESSDITDEGLLSESEGKSVIDMPELPVFCITDRKSHIFATKSTESGVTFELIYKAGTGKRKILDSRDASGKGVLIEQICDCRINILMNDGVNTCYRSSDKYMLKPDQINHIAIIIDGGPDIVSYVINGMYNDGGQDRIFGFGRFSTYFKDMNGKTKARVCKNVLKLRIYGRALLTSEIISNGRGYKKGGKYEKYD